MNRKELREEIAKRAPWYQRIEFPEYGMSTLDDPSWAILDGAPDNQLDGLSPEQAALNRPQPKWRYIKTFLPDLTDLDVMEIGCANGFFSLQFAQMGARHVYGIDRGGWINNAPFAQEVLGIERVSWIAGDFFNMGFATSPLKHERNPDAVDVFLDCPDVVFMSSAFVHFNYPFLALHKLVCLAKKFVIIDEGPFCGASGENRPSATFYWEHGGRAHAFTFSPRMFVKFLWRQGISPSNIKFNYYPKDLPMRRRRCCIVIDVGADQSSISDSDLEFYGGDDRWRPFSGTVKNT